MAVTALEIPLINPLRFLPVDGEIAKDARDNLVHFNQDWFVRYIREWQSKANYVQPWQFNDRITIHFHTNGIPFPSVKLIDCSGKVWYTWTPTNFYTVAGNQVKIGEGVYEPADTYNIRLRLSEVTDLPEGVYLFHLVQPFAGSLVRNNVSEPFSVAQQHPNTSRVDYYNSYNRHDVLFTQTSAKFSIRLAADIQDYTPTSTDAMYEDGGNNARLLGSTPYMTAKYVTTERIPEWMLEKLNYAWSCDNVAVDSEKFVKEPGAKWEVSRIPRFPKVAAALTIREADNNKRARQVVAGSIDIFEIPAYPFVVKYISLTSSSGEEIFVLIPSVIYNSDDLTALLILMNTTAAFYGYSGTFSVSGGKVVWTNVGGDMFLSSIGTILTSPLTYEVSHTQAEAIQFTAPDVIIDWGDNTLESVTGAGVVSSTVKTYSGSSAHSIKIFGTYTTVKFDDGYLTNVGGSVPVGLTEFTISNSFTITSFDCAILANALPTLQRLAIFQCSALATVTNVPTDMPSINYVSFGGNILSTPGVSTIVFNVYSSVAANSGPGFGQLYVNNQTPPAPLNFGGASAAASLAGFGWTVFND